VISLTDTYHHLTVLSESIRVSPLTAWFSVSSRPYRDHPYKTGQNSSYPHDTHMILQPVLLPLTLTSIPGDFEAELFTGRLPFLLPTQQLESTEDFADIRRPISGHYALLAAFHCTNSFVCNYCLLFVWRISIMLMILLKCRVDRVVVAADAVQAWLASGSVAGHPHTNSASHHQCIVAVHQDTPAPGPQRTRVHQLWQVPRTGDCPIVCTCLTKVVLSLISFSTVSVHMHTH